MKELYKIVEENFDLTPKGLINDLRLLSPIYGLQQHMVILEEKKKHLHGKKLRIYERF